ncbi:MAG: flagellar assembly protein FliW [Deltaproteobacteria bacterium]|nr:flagellar assembly protein FliW [Deltaproteobacteria bacterium]
MGTINTERFGPLEIDETRIIHFPDGLLGFPECRNYVILEHQPGSPFCWLQSVDVPELAFVMANPFQIKGDYLDALSPEEKALFANKDKGNIVVFALVTIPPGQVEKMTINLLGPIVIDSDLHTGRQVILANSGYHTRHPLVHQ